MQAQMDVRKSAPFFTVGLTTYKRPALLGKAIQSVLAQSFTDYEFIVIDDASPDDTRQRIEEIDVPNLTYIRQPTTQGIKPARNEIIKRAQGEFIVFLDDDDRFTPDFLHYAYQVLKDVPATVGFAISGRATFRTTEQGDTLLYATNSDGNPSPIQSGEHYLQNPIGGGSGLIVRTVAARAVGGFTLNPVTGEDLAFMLCLAEKWDYAIIPAAILLVYSIQEQQLTHNRAKVGEGSEWIADMENLRRYPRTRSRLYRLSARMYYAAKQSRNGRRSLWKAVGVAPLSVKTWGLFLLLEVNPLLPLPWRRRLLSHHRHGYQPT